MITKFLVLLFIGSAFCDAIIEEIQSGGDSSGINIVSDLNLSPSLYAGVSKPSPSSSDSGKLSEYPKPAAPQEPLPAAPQQPLPAAPQQPLPAAPQQPIAAAPQHRFLVSPQKPLPAAPQQQLPAAPQKPLPAAPQQPLLAAPQQPLPAAPQQPLPAAPQQPIAAAPQHRFSVSAQKPLPAAPQQPLPAAPQRPLASVSYQKVEYAQPKPQVVHKVYEQVLPAAPKQPQYFQVSSQEVRHVVEAPKLVQPVYVSAPKPAYFVHKTYLAPVVAQPVLAAPSAQVIRSGPSTLVSSTYSHAQAAPVPTHIASTYVGYNGPSASLQTYSGRPVVYAPVVYQ